MLANGNYNKPTYCHQNYTAIEDYECLGDENYYLYKVIEGVGKYCSLELHYCTSCNLVLPPKRWIDTSLNILLNYSKLYGFPSKLI